MPSRELTPNEQREWRALLLDEPGGTLIERPVNSGYSSDRVDRAETDHLSIQPDVDAFARLICLKETTPPLAIALFGAWGSGKTFFMRRMQQAVRKLCDEQRADPDRDDTGESAFATEIRQIEFNAWTYADKDLLASLAVELFEKLVEYTTGETKAETKDREQNEKLLNALESARVAEQDAQQMVEDAEGALQLAESDLVAAKVAAENKRAELEKAGAKTYLDVLRDQALDPDAALGASLKNLGLDGITKNAADVIELRDRTQDILGRLGVLGRRIARNPFGDWWLIALIVAIAGLSFVEMIPGFSLDGVLVQISGAAAGTLAWLGKALSTIDGILKPVEESAAAFDARRAEIEASIDAEVTAAREAKATEEANVETLLTALRQKEADVADAQAALAKDTPNHRLNRFIQERANTSDYRQHLGIVRLLKDDFERLSHLMKKQRSDEADPSLPRIDRIVLYIDDLDRCKPATVKAVMEAVHLLLSSDLFVVVVGADEKWVSRSLSTQYGDLLVESEADASDQATSADFIEKIFQIPFWLPPMTRPDLETFLDGLLERQRAPEGEAELEAWREIELKVATREGIRFENYADQGADMEIFIQREANPPTLPTPTAIEERVETIESVRFTAAEVKCMKMLGPLLGRTPRAVKRYVNLYRLIRARLRGEELRDFLGLGEENTSPGFPAVQFLLALETGAPRAAALIEDMFATLEAGDPEPLFDKIRAKIEEDFPPLEAERVFRGLDTLDSQNLNKEVDAWARRVSRYSFRRSRWVQ